MTRHVYLVASLFWGAFFTTQLPLEPPDPKVPNQEYVAPTTSIGGPLIRTSLKSYTCDKCTIGYSIENNLSVPIVFVYSKPVEYWRHSAIQYYKQSRFFSQSLRFNGVKLLGLPVIQVRLVTPGERLSFDSTYFEYVRPFTTEFAIAKDPSLEVRNRLWRLNDTNTYASDLNWIRGNTSVVRILVDFLEPQAGTEKTSPISP